MTEARQKAEERLAKELDVTKDSDGRFMWVKRRGTVLPAGYEIPIKLWNALVSREQELEKLREMAKEVIAVGQPYLEDCDIIGMKDGGWKAKMPKLSQWLSVCSKAAKWKSALPEAPKEGQ